MRKGREYVGNVENFLADDCSSDENVDYNTIVEGTPFHHFIHIACQFDPSVVVHARYMMDVLIDCGRGQNGLEDSKFHQLTLKGFFSPSLMES